MLGRSSIFSHTVIREHRAPTRFIWLGAMILLAISLTGCDFINNMLNPPSDTVNLPALITKAIPQRPGTAGEIFFIMQFKVYYWNGKLLLSSSVKGDGNIFVDDSLGMKVVHQDKTEKSKVIDFTNSCAGTGPIPPEDITDLFLPGKNSVEITFFDACGGSVGSSVLWLVNTPTPGPP